MYDTLTMEKRNGYAIITINRPKAFNALSRVVMQELDDAMVALENDHDAGVVIITGSGKAFVAGSDITEMLEISAVQARDWSRFGQAVFARIENFERPVIAAINGFALGGGCELAMACDIRISSSSAKFGQPEVNLGITPGFAGTQRLTRLVGKGLAKLLIFTGEMINAEEALQVGLVDKVVAPEDLMPTAEALAIRILSKAPLAVAQAKASINKGIGMTLEDASAFEAEAFGICFTSPDQQEGMKAFIEKRPPVFGSVAKNKD